LARSLRATRDQLTAATPLSSTPSAAVVTPAVGALVDHAASIREQREAMVGFIASLQLLYNIYHSHMDHLVW
jgi:hypothetical protein